jgi:hypothetical protein
MPSSAISAQQSALRIGTSTGTGRAITGISKANPAVVTSTGHALADGSIVRIDGVGGMEEVNGRAFVTTSSAANSFALRGIDSTNFTNFTSGGTAVQQSMTLIGNAKTFDIQPDEAADISVTNLASIAQEFRIGLKGSWSMSADIDIDPADAGQTQLIAAQSAGAARAFTVTLQNGRVFAGVGYVKSLSAAGSPDGVVSGQLNIRGTGEAAYFV